MHEGAQFFYYGGPFMALLWYLMVTVPFAIGFYCIAQRLGRSGIAWAILMLIPIANWFFAIYAVFSTVLYMLDRLNEIPPRPAPVSEGGEPV